jgi:hypothetical protein
VLEFVRLTGITTVAKTSRKAKLDYATQGSRPASQRKVIVFMALLTVMTATSALLLALAPAPLTAGTSSSLFAVGTTPDSLDAIFQTPAPVQPGRWKYVFIHDSTTDGGSAATLGESAEGLADHFVIGNGDGCGDGELQIAQRWHRQKEPGKVEGRTRLRPDCVTICLIGDFSRSLPTSTQMLRLKQLVTALQARCDIRAENVHVAERTASASGVGRYFPAAKLREALLP